MNWYLFMYIVFIIGVFLSTIGHFDEISSTPKEIYEINNCNMLGAWGLFILWIILNPLFNIAKFLYWLFHVGRDD